MNRKRIVFQNWIVELGRDPDVPLEEEQLRGDPTFISLESPLASLLSDEELPFWSESPRSQLIRQKVSEALERIDDDEREFIERFYFAGQSYRQIADQSGRALHKLEAVHKRALKRLRKLLRPAISGLFDLTDTGTQCAICRSPFRFEIDGVIASRDQSLTWRPIIREISQRYGLQIRSPQTLIGHEKYH